MLKYFNLFKINVYLIKIDQTVYFNNILEYFFYDN